MKSCSGKSRSGNEVVCHRLRRARHHRVLHQFNGFSHKQRLTQHSNSKRR